MIENIVQIITIMSALFCIGVALALTTIYVGRSYAVHVVPMGVSMVLILSVVLHGVYVKRIPLMEREILAAALMIKSVGLWMILKKVQSRVVR